MTYAPIQGECPVCHQDSTNTAFKAGAASRDAEVAKAFEAGRQAERIVTIKDDDDLRFIKRVLEGANQTEEDKAKCLQLIREIRIRARGDRK